MLDLVIIRIGMIVEQLSNHQDKAGSTESALECARLDEGLLHGVELAVGIKTLDRCDLGTVDERCEIKATRHRPTVDDHRTTTTQALTAAFARAVEAKVRLQQLDQIVMRFNFGSDQRAVEPEADGASGRHLTRPRAACRPSRATPAARSPASAVAPSAGPPPRHQWRWRWRETRRRFRLHRHPWLRTVHSTGKYRP